MGLASERRRYSGGDPSLWWSLGGKQESLLLLLLVSVAALVGLSAWKGPCCCLEPDPRRRDRHGTKTTKLAADWPLTGAGRATRRLPLAVVALLLYNWPSPSPLPFEESDDKRAIWVRRCDDEVRRGRWYGARKQTTFAGPIKDRRRRNGTAGRSRGTVTAQRRQQRERESDAIEANRMEIISRSIKKRIHCSYN